MSKIFFKVNNKKADDVVKENAEIPGEYCGCNRTRARAEKER